MNNLNNSTFIRNGQILQFEMAMDAQDIAQSQFDMRKYRKRQRNVVTAGGFVKASANNLPSARSAAKPAPQASR